MRRTVKWAGPNHLQVTDLEPGDGLVLHARLFYRRSDGTWTPPLPPDLELPAAEPTRRSAATAGRLTRSARFGRVLPRRKTSQRPAWLLDTHDPHWRL
jgi:hypothetical protein